jgi:ribonucleoside-diphosphate reductase alpha chain
MISLALRSGIPLMEIHKQLRGISSDRAVGLGPNKVLSVPDAIGMALEEWWREKQGVQQDLLAQPSAPAVPAREQITPPDAGGMASGTPAPVSPAGGTVAINGAGGQAQPLPTFDAYSESFMGTCPDCGSQLEYAEGCVKCHVCGFSECG